MLQVLTYNVIVNIIDTENTMFFFNCCILISSYCRCRFSTSHFYMCHCPFEHTQSIQLTAHYLGVVFYEIHAHDERTRCNIYCIQVLWSGFFVVVFFVFLFLLWPFICLKPMSLTYTCNFCMIRACVIIHILNIV